MRQKRKYNRQPKPAELAVAEIENTEDLEVSQEQKTNGNGNKPHELLKHSFDNAFQSQQGVNSLKYVVETGDNPLDLLMRSLLPSKRTDAYRLVVAIATVMRKCRAAKYEEGLAEMRDILALLPSMDGKSREQLVSALTGYINSGAGASDNNKGISSSLRKAFQGQ